MRCTPTRCAPRRRGDRRPTVAPAATSRRATRPTPLRRCGESRSRRRAAERAARRARERSARASRRDGCARRSRRRAPARSVVAGRGAACAAWSRCSWSAPGRRASTQLSRQVYFVGTNDAGLVTLYRGVPYDLPFGVDLYEEDYASARARPRDPGRAPRAGARPRVAQARGRRGPRPRARAGKAGRRWVRRLMSARTRELFGLVPVSLLVAAGFAAVLSTRTRGRQRRHAHLRRSSSSACACSRTCSSARGCRTPTRTCSRWRRCWRRSAWSRSTASTPSWRASRRSGSWSGWRFFCATIVFLRDIQKLERYRYLIALRLDRAADGATHPRHRRADQRRLPGDRARADPVPAGRVREARDHRLPRQLPARDGRHPRAPAVAPAALPASAAALRPAGGVRRC